MTKPNKLSKNAIKVILAVKTMADTSQVAFERLNFLSSTRYATGTSVDEIVEVSAAIDNNEKKSNCH